MMTVETIYFPHQLRRLQLTIRWKVSFVSVASVCARISRRKISCRTAGVCPRMSSNDFWAYVMSGHRLSSVPHQKICAFRCKFSTSTENFSPSALCIWMMWRMRRHRPVVVVAARGNAREKPTMREMYAVVDNILSLKYFFVSFTQGERRGKKFY